MGYTVVGEEHRYRARGGNFLRTAFWVLVGMATLALAGFFAARDYLAPRYVPPSAVRAGRPQPIRILSPDEAANAARDEPSHVWTQGVRPSDIPKLEPAKQRERRTTPTAKTPRPEPPAAEAPSAPPGEQPAPEAAPADGGAEGPTPPAPAPDADNTPIPTE